jgi:hypothetical protein
LEALLATHVPGVAAEDKVVINRRSLILEIWPGGDQKYSYSFYTAGSGGKKTLFTICFALALHRTAALREMPVPTLLIIDTPLRNITPDINPDVGSCVLSIPLRGRCPRFAGAPDRDHRSTARRATGAKQPCVRGAADDQGRSGEPSTHLILSGSLSTIHAIIRRAA